MASGVKYFRLHGWAYYRSCLCGCCRPAIARAGAYSDSRGHPMSSSHIRKTERLCVDGSDVYSNQISSIVVICC